MTITDYQTLLYESITQGQQAFASGQRPKGGLV
jgi:hypothetical protein